MSNSALDEEVLVIPSSALHAAGLFQGFCAEADRYIERLFRPEYFQFLPRSKAESDPAYKQLIPYVVLRHGAQVFVYRRGKAGNEKRLHELLSIGVGGHIGHDDLASEISYRTAMLRELTEEINLPGDYTDRCLGLINDDSTGVGQVHLGIVHVFELSTPEVSPRENALREGQLLPLAQLKRRRDEFETWSQFVLDVLD
jgi:predicted NUDIX family phosphoesterase